MVSRQLDITPDLVPGSLKKDFNNGFNSELDLDPQTDLFGKATLAVEAGTEFFFSLQREQGHWCAELESNPTITAEYVFLGQMLGLDLSKKSEAMLRYFFNRQNPDGSWGIARGWDGDVSTTVEVYLALRLLGLEIDHPVMKLAESYILGNGGVEKVRIFTRIFLAMFGLTPWSAIPAIPPETILLPPQSFVNIYSLASWARGTMVPLFIIFHHQPVYALPNGRSEHNDWLDHLWLDPKHKAIPYSSPLLKMILQRPVSWKSFFGATDLFLKLYERARIGPIRKKALNECVKWILDRQETTGDWAGIFPPMLKSVIALTLQGYSIDSEPVAKGIKAIENFSWEDSDGYRIQACVSPVWDTVLGTVSLVDSGTQPSHPRLKKAMDWVKKNQIRVDHGDWKVYRPNLTSGGWAFEYANTWYPDVDDTAACILALLKQDPKSARGDTVKHAVEWVLGMQNRDGGWAAFDVNNDKLFLNQIPFSDMDSLCDPSSPDVTGRVLEAFGLLTKILGDTAPTAECSIPASMRNQLDEACKRGINYLRATQESAGSWLGRWGVNYIYGTSNVLCGLSQLDIPADDPMIERAVRWLRQVQNHDGGWGESLASYSDSKWMGRGESTASQTAWALMGLLAYRSPASTSSVDKGIAWLVDKQVEATPSEVYEGGKLLPKAHGGTWKEPQFTGTGFPNHFYLRYHFYRHYFPMMALGRYLQVTG
ncbi:MAG: squalene--hopene cyclase [Oligoflexia bacterium]|nr:squalene--hopene cyclase [Oligoflexia bacterium]